MSVAHRNVIRRGAVVLILLGLGACTDDQAGPDVASDPVSEPVSEPAGTDADAPYLVEYDAPLVSCGGSPGWTPSIMADGVPAPLTDDEMVGIFRDLLADPEVNGELQMSFLAAGAEDTEWRVLVGDSHQMMLGLGTWTDEGPAEGAYVFGLERDGDRWRWTGGGDCALRPVLKKGHTWVELHGDGIDRTSSEPMIEVNELACTGSRDPTPHLHEPYVVETDESVTVYWTSTPPLGGQTCPGNPTVARPLTLEEPLGDRPLLDGSTYPPSLVGGTVEE